MGVVDLCREKLEEASCGFSCRRDNGAAQGTLRLDPIALYDSTWNGLIASALWTQTSVKVFWIRSQPSSQFPQTHRTCDFEPPSGLQTRLEGSFYRKKCQEQT